MYNMPITPFGSFGFGCTQGIGNYRATMPQEPIFDNNCNTQKAQQIGYEQGKDVAMRMTIPQDFDSAVSKLGSMEQKLNSYLQSEHISEPQKAAIKAMLEKIKAKKEEVENKRKNLNFSSMDIQELEALQQEVKNLSSEVKGFGEEATTLIKQVQETIIEAEKKAAEKAAKAAEQTSNPGSSTDTTTSETTSGSSTGGAVKIGDIEVDTKTGRPVVLGEKPKESDIEAICAKIYQSVNVSGTNHDVLDATMNDINGENIIEIIKQWEDGYGKHHNGDDKKASHKERNQGFFARIFDDVGDDWQSQYVPVLLKALTDRAEALGMYDDIKTFASAVNKELANGKTLGIFGGHDDHVLADNLMKIYNKIAEKEKGLKDKATEQVKAEEVKTEQAKLEEGQEQADKEKEIVATFIADMREIWKDDALEINTSKVTYKDGQFKIRIEGKDYYGADFNALKRAVENAGYDPKKYLCKQQVSVNA